MEDARGRLRDLPSVDEVLSRPAVRALEVRVGRAAVKAAVRQAIAAARERILSGAGNGSGELVPDQDVLTRAQREAAPRLRRVINATGVVLHTNLGRAPLHPDAIARVAEVASGYSNLELDLDTGRRGHRSAAVEPLLCELFGAESAHAVNNCAGATLLALAALGSGGAAVVSRGELVEIGGGFRVPEILAQSGCRLVEVGTTNRTRLSDYASALDGLPRALLLRVHRSNFALVGFTQEATVAELATLARQRGVPLLHDLGSGDKLLGGPQAGILLGRRDLVEACRKHPLARALRADRMLLAALEATLKLYRAGRAGELPVNQALGARADQLSQRATRLALDLTERGIACAVVESEGRVGGGSIPLARLPGFGVAVEGGADLLEELRRGDPAVVALLRDDRVVLDVRCAVDVGELAAAVARARARAGERPPEGGRLGRNSAGVEAPDGTEV